QVLQASPRPGAPDRSAACRWICAPESLRKFSSAAASNVANRAAPSPATASGHLQPVHAAASRLLLLLTVLHAAFVFDLASLWRVVCGACLLLIAAGLAVIRCGRCTIAGHAQREQHQQDRERTHVDFLRWSEAGAAFTRRLLICST